MPAATPQIVIIASAVVEVPKESLEILRSL
jgi:hypothetical protein